MSSHAEELGWVGKQLGLRLGTDWSYVSGAAVMALDGYVLHGLLDFIDTLVGAPERAHVKTAYSDGT